MNTSQDLRLIPVLLCMAFSASVLAKAPADQVERLGKDLTPVGAEMTANKDGTIPAWTGGVTKPPAGFNPSKGYLNPFAADKVLYTITAANVSQYQDKLAPGQLALLKRYPTYKMNVYPSRRSAGYPDAVYAGVKKEAGQIELSADGNAVLNLKSSSVPFPVPTVGVEAIWNNAFRYRGDTVKREVVEFPVQTNGSFTPVRRLESIMFKNSLPADMDNQMYLYRTIFSAPSSIAGEAILLHEFIDQVKQPRAAWVYNPGSRRVLRAPEVSHDAPRSGIDGLGTIDDYDGFQGSPERYDWKLIGKREMIISYNNFALTDKALKYADIVKANVLNQDLVRYEPHRVWVVEATLKKGQSHVYGKRIFFLDEDSWQIAHADLYDGRGELWRVFEQHAVQFYDAPGTWTAGATQYDLQARRYVASAFANEEKPYEFNKPMKAADFTSSALRRQGD